jgi:predicted GNAT family acetyltransferase
VLIHVDGVPAATAAWTAVADEVTEIAGVATIHSHRRRGLGAIATAYATLKAFEQGGATLAWLTPGDDGADRIYRRLGYTPQATAVHLGDPEGHLTDLR